MHVGRPQDAEQIRGRKDAQPPLDQPAGDAAQHGGAAGLRTGDVGRGFDDDLIPAAGLEPYRKLVAHRARWDE